MASECRNMVGVHHKLTTEYIIFKSIVFPLSECHIKRLCCVRLHFYSQDFLWSDVISTRLFIPSFTFIPFSFTQLWKEFSTNHAALCNVICFTQYPQPKYKEFTLIVSMANCVCIREHAWAVLTVHLLWVQFRKAKSWVHTPLNTPTFPNNDHNHLSPDSDLDSWVRQTQPTWLINMLQKYILTCLWKSQHFGSLITVMVAIYFK